MELINQIDDLTRRTRRREFEDGLMDYVLALTFLLLGALGGFFLSPAGLRWYFTSLLRNREVIIIGEIGAFVLFILILFGARRLIAYIRRRSLWKNRGFVKSLRWQVSPRVNLLGGGAMIAMLTLAFGLMRNGLVNGDFVLRTLVAAAGVATGIVLFGMGRELEVGRYRWVGIIGGALSTLIILVPLSFSAAWLALGIGWMLILSVSGTWALRKSIAALEEAEGD
jgi:MFS family permease